MNRLLKHVLFWIGFLTAFWGSFEMAYDSGSHPIWSGTWGPPIPHHYVIGFVIVGISYFLLTRKDWTAGVETFINRAGELMGETHNDRKKRGTDHS